MMRPPITEAVKNSVEVQALLGSNPIRFWPFGKAPRDAQGRPASGVPYAVWQTTYGSPFNFLAGRPTDDAWGTQVDVYAKTPSAARDVAEALRDAFEPEAYVVSWNGELVDPDTKLYRYSFTVEWNTTRT